MITLHDKDSGVEVGTVTEADFTMLANVLEEESQRDTDYYFQAGTIDLLEKEGASVELVGLLRSALGTKEGVELVWTRS